MSSLMKKTAFLILLITASAMAQQKSKTSDYLLGDEEKLEMVVAIWGEVKKPGEYRVDYNTNIIELISIAGGPSQDANLSKVQLTRQATEWSISPATLESIIKDSGGDKIKNEELKRRFDAASRKIVYYNVDKYLSDQKMLMPPPILQPGDVVHVRKNSWVHWRELITVIHEVALIASVYVWFLRYNN